MLPASKLPQVLLFRGRGLVSRLIRWQTRGIYAHAAILMPDGETLLEAWTGDGVHITKIKDFEGVDRYNVKGMTFTQWERALKFGLEQVGKHYDYLGVLRFVSRRNAANRDSWFCSELVFATIEAGGVNLLSQTAAWEVSPRELARSPFLELDRNVAPQLAPRRAMEIQTEKHK